MINDKKDILIVNINKTYKDKYIYDENGNLNEKYIKDSTRESWRLKKELVEDNNIKYIIGIKNGEIKSVYGVIKYYKVPRLNGKQKERYGFEVKDLNNEIKEKIINGIYNKKILLKQVRIKYLRSEDILN